METKFQLVCMDIDDIDKPLQYAWDYLPGNKTDLPDNWKQCTFPKQGMKRSFQIQNPLVSQRQIFRMFILFQILLHMLRM